METDHQRIGRRSQRNIVFGDLADRAGDHFRLDFLGGELGERLGDRFTGTAHVGFDDDIERVAVLAVQFAEQVLGGGDRTGREHVAALFGDPVGRFGARRLFRFENLQRVARIRDAGKTDDLDRGTRAGGLHALVLVVDQGTDFAVAFAAEHHVADMEGAVLNQYAGGRPEAVFQLRFEDDALGRALRVGLELKHFRFHQDAFEQVGQPLAGLGRHRHGADCAAPVLTGETVLLHVEQHLVRVGVRQVDLVDRHDDRHLGRQRLIHRFDGLGLEAFRRRHDQHHEVGRVGAAGPHVGESRVSGGVDERDALAFVTDGGGSDMLGDRASFLVGDMGVADRILQ